MEIDQNTKDLINRENKSDINLKDIQRHIMSSQSANQLTKDLITPRESLFEDDKSSSINYENLYLNTESNIPPSSGNYNERINTNENINFDDNSSQNNINIFYNNTEENINNLITSSSVNNNNNTNINEMNLNNPNNVNNNVDNNLNQNMVINRDNSMGREHKLCYVCELSPIEYFFICANGCCLECLNSHIQSILEKYKQKVFSEKIKFVCVGSCKCLTESEEIEKIIKENSDLKTLHNEVLFKMHLAQAKDIISCPKSNCSNSGYIGGYTACFECNLCGAKIANPNDIFNKDYLTQIFENLKFSNFKSHVLKTFTTKYCNKCQSPIEKADGCKHIECNRCEYSFCWKCTGDWSNHSQTACMGIFSNPFDDNDRPDFFFNICFYLCLTSVLKFISSFYILFNLYYFFMAVLFCAGIFLNTIITAGLINLLIKYNIKSLIIPLSLFVLFEGTLYYYSMHPLSEKIYFFAQVSCNSIVAVIKGTFYIMKKRR